MAGKLEKFLLFSATVGAVGAATYYYLKKHDHPVKHELDEEDDLDDFNEEDLDEETNERNYVTLTPEKVTRTVKKAAGEAKDIAQYAYEEAKAAFQDAKDSLQQKWDTASASEKDNEKVEEFFDDEDEESAPEKAEEESGKLQN